MAEAFAVEWDHRLDPCGLTKFWTPLLDECGGDPEIEAEWIAKATLYCMEFGTDFFWRMVLPTRLYPLVLLWLAASPPDVACPVRQHTAKDVLSKTDEELANETTCKFRFHFEPELLYAAETGFIDAMVW